MIFKPALFFGRLFSGRLFSRTQAYLWPIEEFRISQKWPRENSVSVNSRDGTAQTVNIAYRDSVTNIQVWRKWPRIREMGLPKKGFRMEERLTAANT